MRIVYRDWRGRRVVVEFADWPSAVLWLKRHWWWFPIREEWDNFIREVESL